ncbi:hypothetical protein CPB83DRAFT_754429 [Crepidotus variabilis]|uniref:Ubiquitin-like protease family profile domain-containing protein n=1 Tax=Crepidotus variabilis TaxID=179855 RepID=A0A9P6EV29_9AGAR|nr:hypothetical protein CPB83DRAFT_754429 [Crepidotus variabilis]
MPTSDQLQIIHRAKDDAIRRRIRPPLPSQLPVEDELAVKALLQKRGEIVARYGKERVGDGDLDRLRPGMWLNDEIINFYGAMILGRSEARKENPVKSNEKAPLDIFYLSSFFYEKLTKLGYEKARLAKWTKKVDIFSKDALLMPVNHNNSHWTAASINFRKKRIESYDSMYMFNRHVFPVLRRYLEQEHMEKKKKPFDFTGWIDWAPEDTPRQENGFDCGVFTMHFLEAVSRGEDMFAFSQKDMPYLRRRMLAEIGSAQLRGGHYA